MFLSCIGPSYSPVDYCLTETRRFSSRVPLLCSRPEATANEQGNPNRPSIRTIKTLRLLNECQWYLCIQLYTRVSAVLTLPTCKRGVLREDVFRSWSQHNEDVNDAAFRDPTHICLWCLTGALNIIQHFPKNSLEREQHDKRRFYIFDIITDG